MKVRLTETNGWVTSLLASLIILVDVFMANAKIDIEKRCSTCREISKSFNEGIERTSRFNFEGGDTDWEEKKLGSYSTSETRFIEILEHLCESTKFECNIFVEESEELLEEWWHDHDRDNENFEQWLCLQKAKVCCSENRYGPDCEECLGGITRPCSGNGQCKGGGTRGGNGKCKCSGGYKGDLCNICKKGFYEVERNETDTVCKVCDTSCSSTCSGPGPKACTKCKGGYAMDEVLGCKDIDECKAHKDRYPCQAQQYCQNNLGSYKCDNCDIACTECLGEGNDKCLACRDGFSMVDNICKDIDECVDNPCKTEHMLCSNSPGSYFCECQEGYISDGEICVDKSVSNKTEESPGDLTNGDQPQQEAQSHEESHDTLHKDQGPSDNNQDPKTDSIEEIVTNLNYQDEDDESKQYDMKDITDEQKQPSNKHGEL